MTAYTPFVVPDPTGSIRKAKDHLWLSMRRVAFILGKLPRRKGGTLEERAVLARALADTLQEAADAAETMATAAEKSLTKGENDGTNH